MPDSEDPQLTSFPDTGGENGSGPPDGVQTPDAELQTKLKETLAGLAKAASDKRSSAAPALHAKFPDKDAIANVVYLCEYFWPSSPDGPKLPEDVLKRLNLAFQTSIVPRGREGNDGSAGTQGLPASATQAGAGDGAPGEPADSGHIGAGTVVRYGSGGEPPAARGLVARENGAITLRIPTEGLTKIVQHPIVEPAAMAATTVAVFTGFAFVDPFIKHIAKPAKEHWERAVEITRQKFGKSTATITAEPTPSAAS
ncbi:hypothetical protein AURDEDRAFT_161611 [Auricularia subglabra TFB-10046 SS5]|nr:hypothetical protein AURDEDRAFT_161611 [Auricularia subglabra TFB-10046 SS5]